MDPTADLDSAACNSRKLLQDLATFKKNFPSMQHVFSTGNGPLQNHLEVPSSSAAAEAMLTEPPMLSDADHCTNITAARAQLKDKEKAVDLIQQILQNQNILIDGGVIQRTALKSTMDGLKTAEAALAEATKRDHFYSMIRGSLTEPRRKPNHDDVIWGFFLSVKLADLGALRCPQLLMIALLKSL
ncbi:hypothetical protein CDAR_44211 [Caerostris darwini]|uniref:Uncharacterized protein n=1 Tax=Caerostris darwini TaxID=1538125 RepID=A0AAV4QQA8_9ARAC|nr:hypothetical protein CDAR_44211 [Caerostris darwini]